MNEVIARREGSRFFKLSNQDILAALEARASDKKTLDVMQKLIRMFEIAMRKSPEHRVGLTAAVNLTKLYSRCFGDGEAVFGLDDVSEAISEPIEPLRDLLPHNPPALKRVPLRPPRGRPEQEGSKASRIRDDLCAKAEGTQLRAVDVRHITGGSDADFHVCAMRLVARGFLVKTSRGLFTRTAKVAA